MTFLAGQAQYSGVERGQRMHSVGPIVEPSVRGVITHAPLFNFSTYEPQIPLADRNIVWRWTHHPYALNPYQNFGLQVDMFADQMQLSYEDYPRAAPFMCQSALSQNVVMQVSGVVMPDPSARLTAFCAILDQFQMVPNWEALQHERWIRQDISLMTWEEKQAEICNFQELAGTSQWELMYHTLFSILMPTNGVKQLPLPIHTKLWEYAVAHQEIFSREELVWFSLASVSHLLCMTVFPQSPPVILPRSGVEGILISITRFFLIGDLLNDPSLPTHLVQFWCARMARAIYTVGIERGGLIGFSARDAIFALWEIAKSVSKKNSSQMHRDLIVNYLKAFGEERGYPNRLRGFIGEGFVSKSDLIWIQTRLSVHPSLYVSCEEYDKIVNLQGSRQA